MQILGPLFFTWVRGLVSLVRVLGLQYAGMDRYKEGGRDLPVKRQILPPWTDFFPTFRPKLFGVVPVEVFASVHDINVVLDHRLLGDEKRGFSVWASTFGQNSVDDCHSAIGRDDGVQA